MRSFPLYALCPPALLAISALLASCAGDGPRQTASTAPPATPPAAGASVDFETQVQPLLDSHCSCHLNVNAPQGVVLLPGASYNSLVGVASIGRPDLLLVKPGAPDESVLVIKVDDNSPSLSQRVGDRMPQGLPPLATGDVAIIRQWIEEGALRSATGEDGVAPQFDGATQATPISETEIDVLWNSAVDDISPPETVIYNVYLAAESGAQDFSQAALSTPPGATSLRVGGLAPASDYFFVVRAVDEAGNEEVNNVEVTAKTLDPPGTEPPPISNQAPTADPGGPYEAMAGVPITFSASASTDPDGDPLSFAWSYGDGESGSGENVEHTYAETGTFIVMLVASDGQTFSEPASTMVTVLEAADPFPRDPVMERVCSYCHGLRIILSDGRAGEITPPGLGEEFFAAGTFLNGRVRSAARWASTVDRMRNRNGAPMTDEERDRIVTFLSENYSDGN